MLDGVNPNGGLLIVRFQYTHQDRVSQLVHIRSKDWEILSSILRQLTVDQREIRYNKLRHVDLRPESTARFHHGTT